MEIPYTFTASTYTTYYIYCCTSEKVLRHNKFYKFYYLWLYAFINELQISGGRTVRYLNIFKIKHISLT